MALADNLISYWSLDEASGNALDAHGSNDLTETGGSIGTATGKVGNARDFEVDDTEYFLHADNADLSVNGTDFTVAAWINVESYQDAYVIAKWYEGTDGEFRFRTANTANYFRFGTFDGSTVSEVSSVTFTFPSLGAWSFVVAWYDSGAGTINLSVNDGTVETASSAAAPHATALNWTFGADTNGINPFDGLLDEVGFWKRVLTSGERTELYNSGAGRDYAYVSGGAATFTATAALTVGAATLAATATFVKPTYTGTAALTTGKATLAASATFSPGTKTATAALTTGKATLAASATFAPGTKTATAALTIGPATLAASATFVKPTYTATAALAVGHATLAATATFVKPTYTATAALATGKATLSASAIFATAVFVATAPLTTGKATLAASATFSAGTKTATATLTVGHAVFVASATFTKPTYTGTAALSIGHATFVSSATFAPGTKTATAALVTGRATLAAVATFVRPDHTPPTPSLVVRGRASPSPTVAGHAASAVTVYGR